MDEFDKLLDAYEPAKPLTGAGDMEAVEAEIARRLDEARADPQGFAKANRGLKGVLARRAFRRRLRRDPEMQALSNEDFAAGELWMDSVVSGEPLVGMSDEWKERLHRWIQRALPVLKIIASLAPEPYRAIMFGIIVLLVLIDERRLKPPELAAMLETLSGVV